MGVYAPNIKRPHCCRICPNPVCIPNGINTMDMLDFIMKRRHEHPNRRADDCPLEEIDLVRCGECKYIYTDEGVTLCGVWGKYTFKDGFCYQGERRADDKCR